MKYCIVATTCNTFNGFMHVWEWSKYQLKQTFPHQIIQPLLSDDIKEQIPLYWFLNWRHRLLKIIYKSEKKSIRCLCDLHLQHITLQLEISSTYNLFLKKKKKTHTNTEWSYGKLMLPVTGDQFCTVLCTVQRQLTMDTDKTTQYTRSRLACDYQAEEQSRSLFLDWWSSLRR